MSDIEKLSKAVMMLTDIVNKLMDNQRKLEKEILELKEAK